MAQVVRWRSIPARLGLLWRHCTASLSGVVNFASDRMTAFRGYALQQMVCFALSGSPGSALLQVPVILRFVTEMSFLRVGMVTELSCGSFACHSFSYSCDTLAV
jgi:hypothetical protein